MAVMCMALMHRSHSSTDSPESSAGTAPLAPSPAEEDLRSEVARLRAEVEELRRAQQSDADVEAP